MPRKQTNLLNLYLLVCNERISKSVYAEVYQVTAKRFDPGTTGVLKNGLH